MNWIALVVLTPLLLAALAYLGMPLIVLGILKMRIVGTIVDVTEQDLDASDTAYFNKVADALEPLGFIPVGYLCADEMMANLKIYFLLLARPETQTMAMAGSLHNTMAGSDGKANRYCEYETNLENGVELVTTHQLDAASVDKIAEKKILILPGVLDPVVLHRYHEAWVEEHSDGARRKEIAMDRSPAEIIHESIAREMRLKSDRGFWREADEGVYRGTIKGAYLGAWAQMPPWSTIRKAAIHRKAAAFIARVDAAG